MTFGYCGTGYYGLQSQNHHTPALPTVADSLRQALCATGAIAPSNMEPLTRTKWVLASRTDKGVHAARAAVSFKMETLPSAGERRGGDWQLCEGELARLNEALPPEIRVFSATRVRRSFHARTCASSRTYEYLLPRWALNGLELAEFDGVLRTFEGTQRLHNFCSGLRRATDQEEAFRVGDEEWPLALDTSHRNAAAFRSVVRCGVQVRRSSARRTGRSTAPRHRPHAPVGSRRCAHALLLLGARSGSCGWTGTSTLSCASLASRSCCTRSGDIPLHTCTHT